MIPVSASFLDTASLSIAAWLITYLIHSTLLLGVVRLVARFFRPALAMEDTLWKMALVGAVATALWQAAGPGHAPRLRFDGGDRVFVEASPAEPLPPAPSADNEIVIRVLPERHRSSETGARSLPEDDAVAGAATTLSPTTVTWAAAPAAAPARGGARKFLAATRDRLHRLVTGLSWNLLLLAAWALGAVTGLLRLALVRFRLHRLLRDRRELTEGHLVGMLDRLRRAADMRRPVRLSLSSRLAGPVALGRDEICLPGRVLTDLTPGQQQTVLAHELAHLERGDPGWLWLAAAMETVFFFQPLNRIARRRLRDLAEFLCDDWAVRHAGGNLILARCLAEVAGWVQTSPALASGMAQKSSPLVRRIERLLEDRDLFREPGRGWRWLAGLVLVGAVAVAAPGITTGSYERPDNAPWTAGPSPWPDYPFVLTPPGWTTTPLSASAWDASPPVEGDGQLGELFGYPAAPATRSLPPSPREAVRLHRERTLRAPETERSARWVWQARPQVPEPRPLRAPAEPRSPSAVFSGEAEIPSADLAAVVEGLNAQLEGPISIALGDLTAAIQLDAEDGVVDLQFQLDRLAESRENVIQLKELAEKNENVIRLRELAAAALSESERDSTFFRRQRDDLLRQAAEIRRHLKR